MPNPKPPYPAVFRLKMVELVRMDRKPIALVRFPGWQGTQAGEREVKKALCKALFKYRLHADEDLFEKSYSYIRQCFWRGKTMNTQTESDPPETTWFYAVANGRADCRL